MSYRDWSEDDYETFQALAYEEIYNNLPTVPYLDTDTDEQARELFELGWLTFGELSPAQLDSIRDQFYDLIGITPDQFDWEDYRDLYSATNG